MSNKTVATGLGLLGTTFEKFRYDGLSRLLTAQDDDSSVSLVYDSLSRVTSTTQNAWSSGDTILNSDKTRQKSRGESKRDPKKDEEDENDRGK